MSRINLVDQILRLNENSKPLWNCFLFISVINRYKTYIRDLNFEMNICVCIKHRHTSTAV